MADVGSYLLAEVMLWLMYIVVVVAVVVVVVSAVRPLMIAPRRGSGNRGWMTVGGTAAVLLLTWLMGSSKPLVVNGTVYNETFWLKTTDMLIVSALILMFVAAALVLFGISGLSRRMK